MNSTKIKCVSIFKIMTILLLCLKRNVVCEPHCSRFHYEEQTLEKMMRLEYLVKNMYTEMEENKKATKDALEDALENVLKFKQDLSDEFMEFKDQTVREREKQIEDFNSLRESPAVLFQARNPSTLDPKNGEKIIFTTLLQDTTLSYNNTTGIFTAPLPGTYLFNVQLCLASGVKYVHYSIVVETRIVTNTLLYDASQRFCNSATAVVNLRRGNSVHIQVRSTTGDALSKGSAEWNTFTGVMLKT